jgi:hypothetical protein
MAPRAGSIMGLPGQQAPFEGAMTFDQFKRLYGALGAQESSGQDQNTTPTAPPQPSDQLKGLMAQAADPYGTYGQLGVANPYMQNLTNRFGYDPSGLAYGVDLQKSPSWYLPGNVYPNVYQPKFTAAAMPYGIGQM